MAKRYMDWADWAGDNHELAEAEPRELRAKWAEQCEHEDISNQGVCEDCDEEVEGWEPSEMQLDAHHGTSYAA